MPSVSKRLALVYQPSSYVRRGPPESCMQIVKRYPDSGVDVRLLLVRTRVSTPANVKVVSALPSFLRDAAWKLVRSFGLRRLNRLLIRQLRQLDPANTIVIIWPGWPPPPLMEAKRLGFTLVREMINSSCATAKPILDEAYARHGLAPNHNVTAELVASETAELQLYDYIFSGNDQVDQSLRDLGIPDDRILKTSFGYDASRFAASVPHEKPEGVLRFLFVGSVGIRKGVPELLDAWRIADLSNAELLIVGGVEPDYQEQFESALPPGAGHIPFTDDIGGIYKSADVFVFPTLEEGGPQVGYEAASCGAAVITTPMGQARMVEDEVNGLVIPPADSAALARALQRISADSEFRAHLRANAVRDAARFEYQRVGEQRAQLLKGLKLRGDVQAPADALAEARPAGLPLETVEPGRLQG